MGGRRFLSLWLPRLATDRLARERRRAFAGGRAFAGREVAGEGEAFAGREAAGGVDAPARPWATIVKENSALRLAALDARAEAHGLAPGQGLSEARALVSELMVAPADPAADAALLDEIARAADRYTPLVGLAPPDGLVLDITGCAHLFGGEEGLCADLLARLSRAGFSARAAVADTIGAAWAVARYGGPPVVPREGARAALEALPAAALRLDPESVAVLARLGLKTVGAVLAQPRAPLVARFGPGLARRIDQALGREDESFSPRLSTPALMAERRFAEPLFHAEGLAASLAGLAATLAGMLERRGEGGRRFALVLFFADGAVRRIEAGASAPLAAAERIAALFRPKLDALPARAEGDGGIDLVRLAALETAPAAPRQGDFEGRAAAAAGLAGLVDTLSARLGAEAVQRLAPEDTHQPEAAVRAAPALHTPAAVWPAAAPAPHAFDAAWPAAAAPARHTLAAARPAVNHPPGEPRTPAALRPLSAHPPGESHTPVARLPNEPPTPTLRPGAPHTPTARPAANRLPGEPPDRPLRLFARPEPVEVIAAVPDGPPARFRWRKVLYRVAAAEGPERIAAEWWHAGAPPPTRDYFRVEDVEGRRFWLFRHGLFAREPGPPRWFLHGLFG